MKPKIDWGKLTAEETMEVLRDGFDQLSSENREQIVAEFTDIIEEPW